MRIKTFYAKSMAEALQEIKTELGPEALLLSTKEIPSRSTVGSSGFEVVAATDSSDESSLLSAAVHTKPEALKGETSSADHGTGEEGDAGIYSRSSLRKGASTAQKRRSGCGKPPARLAGGSAAEAPRDFALPFSGTVSIALYRDLVTSGVHDWLATKLLTDALKDFPPRLKRSRSALQRAVASTAQALIPAPTSENGLPVKRGVAFVGPTGVGKTTSIAKLAAHLALRQKKRVMLMTLDGFRIGAIEQLRTYAGLMGIPFRYADSVPNLRKAMQENSQRDYILIDTAGRGPRDVDAMRDVAEFLQESADVERHLVLSATTKPSDIREIVDRFEICKPDHLLFTKLDETTTPGPIFNELVRTQKSFTYYTDGQRVPEDLHAVTKDQILELILHVD